MLNFTRDICFLTILNRKENEMKRKSCRLTFLSENWFWEKPRRPSFSKVFNELRNLFQIVNDLWFMSVVLKCKECRLMKYSDSNDQKVFSDFNHRFIEKTFSRSFVENRKFNFFFILVQSKDASVQFLKIIWFSFPTDFSWRIQWICHDDTKKMKTIVELLFFLHLMMIDVFCTNKRRRRRRKNWQRWIFFSSLFVLNEWIWNFFHSV